MGGRGSSSKYSEEAYEKLRAEHTRNAAILKDLATISDDFFDGSANVDQTRERLAAWTKTAGVSAEQVEGRLQALQEAKKQNKIKHRYYRTTPG